MTPMFESPAPRVEDRRDLDLARALPRGTATLRIAVAMGRSDERVHVHIEAWRDRTDALAAGMLDSYSIRCGVPAWRALLLPSLRQFCTLRQLRCDVREVQSGPHGAMPQSPPSTSLPIGAHS